MGAGGLDIAFSGITNIDRGTDGAAGNARPSHASGRFDLHFPGAHIAGAFGAEKE